MQEMDQTHVFVAIQKVYYPLLCIVGIPANLFTFYMICFRTCGMSGSARVYLSCLALADSCYLVWVILLDLCLSFLQPQPFWHMSPWCNLIDFLQYGTFYSCAWLVVAFTVERYLVLRATSGCQRPLQAQHALLTCGAILLLSHLASVPVTWINEVVQVNMTQEGRVVTVPRCLYREALYSTVVVWVTSFLSSGLPIVLVIFFNSLIAHQLLCSSRLFTREERRTMARFQTRASLRRTLLLLVTVSAAFVLLSLPRFVTYCVLRTVHNGPHFDRDDYTLPINVVADAANMLHNLNSSTNFLLYCVVSQRFRRELVNTLRCRGRVRDLGSFLSQTTMKVFSVTERKQSPAQDPVTVVLTKLRYTEDGYKRNSDIFHSVCS